jgi:hypothetical protein
VGKLHDDPAGATDEVRRRRFAFHRQFKQKKTSQWKRLYPQLAFEDPHIPKPSVAHVAGSVRAVEPQSRN